jgi:NAD(P)-dependent dehydrogenase (short-subunit alcohol dehydrogenase family)
MKGGAVVTGASSGIGAAVAHRLANEGFQVFGTVRRPEDLAPLERAGVSPVLMDVTDAAGIAAARGEITRRLGEVPLAGLVNNAGIGVAGPLEHVSLDALRHVLEVNVIGVVAVTQAFLPLLRPSRGRVINIGSVSGRRALPFGGPYSASKFALEAISDSLRRELLPFGVTVVVIQPGSVVTPIWDKLEGMDVRRFADTPYGPVLPRVLEQTLRSGRRGLPPAAVGDAVLKALTAKRPPLRMLVVRQPWLTRLTLALPDRWIDRAVGRRVWQMK